MPETSKALSGVSRRGVRARNIKASRGKKNTLLGKKGSKGKKGKGKKKKRKKKGPRCLIKRRKKALKRKCFSMTDTRALLNCYYTMHGVVEMLKFRKFKWKKKKKRG